MMMDDIADVIIIGAGIIGLSTAFQIARRSALKIVVLEKGPGLGERSTGASSAVCGFRYSRPEMVQLAKNGIEAYRNWSEYLGAATPRARFTNDGGWMRLRARWFRRACRSRLGGGWSLHLACQAVASRGCA
ncbi:MAG: FAD-dependent oxidoreductase [Sphingomicrobium sp.]